MRTPSPASGLFAESWAGRPRRGDPKEVKEGVADALHAKSGPLLSRMVAEGLLEWFRAWERPWPGRTSR